MLYHNEGTCCSAPSGGPPHLIFLSSIWGREEPSVARQLLRRATRASRRPLASTVTRAGGDVQTALGSSGTHRG
jgi:hypothetical protein